MMLFLNKRHPKIAYILFILLVFSLISGCGDKGGKGVGGFELSASQSTGRSNTPNVLTTDSPKTDTIGNEHVIVDISNATEGYLTVKYLGESAKSKLQITGSNGVTYTYNLVINEENVIPLTSGSCTYLMTLYEGVGSNQYSVLYAGEANITVTNELGPYLYPNQYVNFNKDSNAVALAAQLANGAASDLEVVSNVYQYVISNITYDVDEAETVETSYLPDVDEVIATKKGICFDYASLMAAMLRSQSIPTKLELGYASDAYHAWISVYTKDQGWIDGVIEFNGSDWILMDPTFASTSKNDRKKMRNFIGSGDNYVTKYVY